jgi:hypothetical protein
MVAFEGTVSNLWSITDSDWDFVIFLRRDGHSWVRIPGRTRNLSLLQNFQTGSGTNPGSYSVSTGRFFQGMKRPNSDADHSPASTAAVKSLWSFTLTPPYSFMACVGTSLWSGDCQGIRHVLLCLKKIIAIFLQCSILQCCWNSVDKWIEYR